METMTAIVVVVLGLSIGSFMNVVALRVPLGESIVIPPSHCPHCGHRLYPGELIPVLSFLVFGGRCRHCRESISWIYPVGEMVTGGLFLWSYLALGWQWELLLAWVLMSILVAASISDMKYMMIPNALTYTGMLIFLLFRFFLPHPHHAFMDYLYGFLVGGGTFLLMILLSHGGMGGGDMKLMAMAGLALGWPSTLLSIFIASLLGTIVGGFFLLLQHKDRKTPFPFGPFLSAAIVFCYFWGETWLKMYWQLLER